MARVRKSPLFFVFVRFNPKWCYYESIRKSETKTVIFGALSQCYAFIIWNLSKSAAFAKFARTGDRRATAAAIVMAAWFRGFGVYSNPSFAGFGTWAFRTRRRRPKGQAPLFSEGHPARAVGGDGEGEARPEILILSEVRFSRKKVKKSHKFPGRPSCSNAREFEPKRGFGFRRRVATTKGDGDCF
jgi:hypothetical protein